MIDYVQLPILETYSSKTGDQQRFLNTVATEPMTLLNAQFFLSIQSQEYNLLTYDSLTCVADLSHLLSIFILLNKMKTSKVCLLDSLK